MNGIDISSYQAELNAGIVPSDFVIIKATEGTNYINPTWEEQAGQVIQTNKLLGFYHFASVGNPIAEADFFISVVKNYIGKAVLVLDFEAGAINAWGNVGARQFLNRVKEKTGINPMIYMSSDVTRQFNWSTISSTNPLWVAQYASMNPTGYQSEPWTDGKGYGAWSSAAIHQYSSAGSLSNWSGNLDINLAYINANQWKSLAGSGSTSNSITTEDININNTIEYEEEEMHFIQTVDTKRIYMINAGMYSWITDPGMWTNYQKAFPKAPVIPLYQAQMEKLYRKNV
ncbi:GH25 family lysozyme [Lactococcus cremoris]|uniref:Bacteriophage lysin n=1 Tax=Lactococcus lactis subsp. cremoris (strain MG1363) TaxID=416870 RepID=A2RMW3_LACLM|nr:GH25 family lysozyme [Lactococcus cremoris]ADJ61051.1 bacteriophage lysin [Lactococcus cremoris subsp. cremoris NZ9000]KZK50727.1 Phage lysin glycosyl hydrolase family 25 [Lactococcus cremoris]MCT4436353.1 lysozyme [Lactococcus cremoris]MCT4445916.1 lysozyme [Lactococcus cremoris]MCZ7688544.1 GH25 family lysozyme [Lactococcus cremoris]